MRGSGLGARPVGTVLGPSDWGGKEGKLETAREGTASSGFRTATAAVFIRDGREGGNSDGRKVPRSLIGGGGGDGGSSAGVGGMSGNIGTAAIGTEFGIGGCITLLGSGTDCF